MTEEDAKTKWCPFVRSTVVGKNENGTLVVISNRDAAQLIEVNNAKVMTHNCIGPACMAWRWAQRVTNEDELGRYRNSGMAMRPVEPEYENIEHGFCGLAGKP